MSEGINLLGARVGYILAVFLGGLAALREIGANDHIVNAMRGHPGRLERGLTDRADKIALSTLWRLTTQFGR
jgi:hypothetical protein